MTRKSIEEARQRKVEIALTKRKYADWLGTLTQVEREVALAAMRTYERIVEGKRLLGGCYLLSFFLNQYLKREKGIETTAVVGWINDGTTPLMISHAWLEFNSKKTDITLTHTEHSDAQLAGELIVLDHVVCSGRVKYTYHRQRTTEAVAMLQKLREEMPWAVDAKEAEHLQMEGMSKSEILIQNYLDAAPNDKNYDALARLLAG